MTHTTILANRHDRRRPLVALMVVIAACIALPKIGVGAETTERDAEQMAEKHEDRLRKLEAKYQETGNSKYLFRRVLTLEEMGEHEFALEVLRENREDFVSNPEVNGIAVVEQRLIDATDGATSSANTQEQKQRDAGDVDLLGLTLEGVGLLAITGGLIEIALAESRARELRCSEDGPNVDDAKCNDIKQVRFESRAEFDRAARRVKTRRLVGVGLTVVGVGLASYGIYRLVRQPKASKSASTFQNPHKPRLSAGLMPGGGAALRLKFNF